MCVIDGPYSSRKKAIRAPCEGKPHARCDERRLETGLWYGLRHRYMAKAAGKRLLPNTYDYRANRRLYLLNERSLEIIEATLGPEHPHAATVLSSIAELMCDRSLAIVTTALGEKHADAAKYLESLAEVYRQTNREEAAQLLERRITAIRDKGGP